MDNTHKHSDPHSIPVSGGNTHHTLSANKPHEEEKEERAENSIGGTESSVLCFNEHIFDGLRDSRATVLR